MSSPAGNCERPPAPITSAAATCSGNMSPLASMPADLLELIGWRVLAGDLLDYIRFRAVCTHSRSSTIQPRPRHHRLALSPASVDDAAGRPQTPP
ncbi:hypothetical protein ZWY2020_011574 [Hordeum vulgare]|nr:hypothetical protein ZWY2020_011574 [Hordeum vulgare]